MAESKPYLLPNTSGKYVTVTVTDKSGEVYRINDDKTRTIYADYSVDNNTTVLDASSFSSQEFQRNLAQNSQAYNRTISNSILEASGKTNSQPDPNQPGAPGTSTPTQSPNSNQNKRSSSELVYPIEMRSTQQDRIKFTAVTYTPSGNLQTGQITSPNRTSTSGKTQVGPAVFLPVQAGQAGISDANSVDWQGASLNAIERELANLSGGLMTTNTMADIEGKLGNFANASTNLISKYGNEARVYLAGEAVGIQNLIGRFGSVLNPNLELLFTGPQLRPFEFSFKLSAREQDEADTVRQIINFFKKNMAVKKSSDGIFLKSPNTFFIEYMYMGKSPHKGINKIKECALTNCSVDYTPLGTYMTYPDGTMVSYTLSLQFQELVPIYDEDYTDPNQIEY